MSTCRGCRSTRCRPAWCGASRRRSRTSCSSTAPTPTRRACQARPPASPAGRVMPTATAIFSRRCCPPATCCCSSPRRRNTARGSWPVRWPPLRPAGRCSSCRPMPRATPTFAATGGGNSSRKASTCRGSFASTASRPRPAPRQRSNRSLGSRSLCGRSMVSLWAVPLVACGGPARSISPPGSRGSH